MLLESARAIVVEFVFVEMIGCGAQTGEPAQAGGVGSLFCTGGRVAVESVMSL